MKRRNPGIFCQNDNIISTDSLLLEIGPLLNLEFFSSPSYILLQCYKYLKIRFTLCRFYIYKLYCALLLLFLNAFCLFCNVICVYIFNDNYFFKLGTFVMIKFTGARVPYRQTSILFIFTFMSDTGEQRNNLIYF